MLVAAAAFKACPELAAGEYQISLKSKLPHLLRFYMVILWPDIESGRDLVELDLDGLGDHLKSNLDGFGDHLDLILDARVPSHLDSILDGPISNLAKIIARFDIRASKNQSWMAMPFHLKSKLDGI